MDNAVKDPETILVRLENVSKQYVVANNVVNALENVTMNIKTGEFILVAGPSGSGKSTLLSLIASIDKPTSGKIFVNNQDISLLNDNQLCDLRRLSFGIVFQFFNLHPFLTAQQNVEMPMLIAGIPKKTREIRSEKLLNLVKMSNRATHKPSELSGGEQQRIGIARALANDPVLLLADEPTGHLDIETGYAIRDLFVELNIKLSKTIILVTHNKSLLKKEMRVLNLIDGRIRNSSITPKE